jgi:hypothetical protein
MVYIQYIEPGLPVKIAEYCITPHIFCLCVIYSFADFKRNTYQHRIENTNDADDWSDVVYIHSTHWKNNKAYFYRNFLLMK